MDGGEGQAGEETTLPPALLALLALLVVGSAGARSARKTAPTPSSDAPAKTPGVGHAEFSVQSPRPIFLIYFDGNLPGG